MSYNKVRGIVAAGHEKTAEAGQQMLESGGNAFDAAVAASFASYVAEPTLTSAGGGGFLLAHTTDGENCLFDFFTQTPQNRKFEKEEDLHFYPITLTFGDGIQDFHIGYASMAVPGNIKGLFHVHKKLGHLPVEEVVKPAIELGRNGMTVSPFNFFCFNLIEPINKESPVASKLFNRDGRLLPVGGLFFNNDFADTLELLAKDGGREFYEGEIAARIVKDCKEKGGFLTAKDLVEYQVLERKPVSMNYRGRHLLTNPPPSVGGSMVALMMLLMETYELQKIPFGSAQHLQRLVNVIDLKNQLRKSEFDDHVHKLGLDEHFFSVENIERYRQLLHANGDRMGSTTHVSVIDELGNAAGCTTSVGQGSAYFVPGTGIHMNNMLGEEDLNPHGFHQWKPNTRVSSNMAPTVVLKNGKPVLALGTGGANRIRTAIFQVLSNILDFNMNLQEAVESPRVHFENDHLDVEYGYAPEEVEKLLLQDHHTLLHWSDLNLFFGGVHVAGWDDDGVFKGFGDPRRSGVVKQVE